MKHVIMKQVIDLRVDAHLNAFSVQHQAREYYYQHLVPVIEKIFDELSSDEEVINIEKLEIDLGNLGWKNDRFSLDEAVLHEILKESLKKSFERASPVPVNFSRRTPEENVCLQWLFYMENGVLPWEISGIDIKWHEKVLHQLAIDHQLIERTKKLLINNRWFLTRIITEHDDTFLEKLTEVITAKQQPYLLENVRQSGSSIRTKTMIWSVILRSVAAGEKEVDIQKALLSKESLITQQPPQEHQEIVEGIYCQFAGLIVLHPFFKHLFSRLQLLEDEKFKDELSRHKAIVLLYFIATGKTEGKDYELVVPKILCGLPLHEVLTEESFMLTSSDKEEALNMMYAAIDQWTIIHNTSPGGLREGFLMREGKVLVKDTNIYFRITSGAIDVLLDHLPWNLSLIKLPWLNELIRVEWR
jgi:hypothetical protein